MSPESEQSLPKRRDAYKLVYPVLNGILNHSYHRTVSGAENIPNTPAIYAPNHIKLADSLLVAAAYTDETGLPLRFGAKQEYFEGGGMNDKGRFGRSMRWLMEHTHQIPVDRESRDPRAFQRLQTDVADRLAYGDSVALHPEGTRSTDGKLHKFKSGAARIAIALSVPIVPVGLVYDERSNRRVTDVEIIFGKPVTPEEFIHLPYSLLPNKQKAEYFSQVVENRVADLTGMEQSGAFAVLRKLRHHPEDKN